MDKTDQPENSSLQHAEFAKMAKQFENVSSSSHNRSPDGSTVTTVRGTLDGVESILTYDSATDKTTMARSE